MDDHLHEAERIGELLEAEGIGVVVIGAVALAAHRYVRFTRDVDLGVNANLRQMRHLHGILVARGYDATFHEPDREDPLGGVIDVVGPFGIVQIVSFANRFPAAIRDALAGETIRTRPDGGLRVMPIPQLVALKLYAGGLKSLADIVELLLRNPEVDLHEVGETCRRYRLRGWEQVMAELQR
jgi:hypothetical protein